MSSHVLWRPTVDIFILSFAKRFKLQTQTRVKERYWTHKSFINLGKCIVPGRKDINCPRNCYLLYCFQQYLRWSYHGLINPKSLRCNLFFPTLLNSHGLLNINILSFSKQLLNRMNSCDLYITTHTEYNILQHSSHVCFAISIVCLALNVLILRFFQSTLSKEFN